MILCIDDDNDVLNLLKKILSGTDDTIISAVNGQQGLIEARNKSMWIISKTTMTSTATRRVTTAFEELLKG